MPDVKRERLVIPIGPQHPALKEPGHFEFTVDGEIVTGGTVRLGYAHRGIEKATESRNWVQNLYLLERICGICSHIHAFAYCLGVEQLAGVTAPPRAQALRVLVAELERIHSHMLWLGVTAHEAGFDTLFMYSWRDREIVMDILEALTGNRVHYSLNCLGGVKFDIDAALNKTISDGINTLDERITHYLDVVQTDIAFRQRTRNIGTMSQQQAQTFGLTGPTARASGIQQDLRVDAPYAFYAQLDVQPVIDSTGDLETRIGVRLKECTESCRLIRSILADLPLGELRTRIPRRIKPGETISRVEAPRGELFYFIRSEGGETPSRIKVRTPTLCNIASVPQIAIGHHLADIPMLLIGIDPCFSCNDRCVQITNGQGSRVLSWRQLSQLASEHARGYD